VRPGKRILFRILLGLVLAFAAVALPLGIAELSLRISGRLRHGVWPQTRAAAFYDRILLLRRVYRRHAYLNTGPREGSSVSIPGRSVAINSLGYRSPERSRHKPPGTARVLISGGSTTFDVLAPDDASAWPNRLEERLRAGGRAVEVWCSGFPGWTSQENVIALAIRDLDLQPDLAVLYQGINDLQPASHQPFDRQYEHGHAEISRRALGLELAPPLWLGRSLAVEWLRDRIRGPSNPWDALGGLPPAARRDRISAAGVATFARNVRSFAALARSRGAAVLLVTQPMRIRSAKRQEDLAYLAGWYPELEPAAAPAALERLNAVVRRLSGGGIATLADAAREIDWKDEDFGDPLHYTGSGRRKLVDYLAPRLAALLAERSGAP
jgi:lysophospholipase L1-like esterase